MIKVGDKVKVVLTGFVDHYKPDVAKLDGRIATITQQLTPESYLIDIDDGKYTWNLEELEPVYYTDDDTKELAETLHDTLCNWNHTDGCDWYYHDKDDFTPQTKQEYYKAAQEIMKIVSKNDMIAILSILKGNRIV